jgi:hypothetical protein
VSAFFREHIEFYIVLALCIALRMIPLFDYQFTYDELSALERTSYSSFSELVQKGIMVDAHPALVQVMLYLITCFGGFSEWLLKLPFLLCSIGSVIYAYACGYRFFGRQPALMIATVTAFSLPFVYHAAIARPYATGIFFSMGLVYHFLAAIKTGSEKRQFALFGLFALLSALNHHIGALFAFTVAASGLFLFRGKALRAHLITCGCVLIAYIPHLYITLAQFGLSGIGPEQGGWLDKPAPDALFGFLSVLFGTGYYYILFAAMCVAIHLRRRHKISRIQWTLLVLFLTNYAIVHLYSVIRAPVFQNSVMMFAGTSLLIFAGSFIKSLRPAMFWCVFAGFTALLIVRTYFEKDYYGNCIETGFEQQFRRLADVRKDSGDTGVAALYFNADRNMKRIYSARYGALPDCYTVEDTILRPDHEKYAGGKSALRLCDEFLSEIPAQQIALTGAMPVHQRVVQKHFPHLVSHHETFTDHFLLYSKIPAAEISIASVKKYSRDSAGTFEFRQSDRMNEEFPFEARSPYAELIRREGQVLLVTATIKPGESFLPDDFEVCISVNDAQNQAIAYSARAASDFLPEKDSAVTVFSQMFMGTRHREMKNGTIGCYVWNRGRSQFKLLDFRIEVIDYWQKKWNFWD